MVHFSELALLLLREDDVKAERESRDGDRKRRVGRETAGVSGILGQSLDTDSDLRIVGRRIDSPLSMGSRKTQGRRNGR